MPYIAAVVPVYQEEAVVPELCRRLREALAEVSADFEIVLVDDGSTDRTWQRILQEARACPRLKGLRFSRNFGQHYAISAGLDAVDSDWVVVMDGDLQDRPEVIPELHAKAREGHDVVFVTRTNRPVNFFYGLSQRLFYSIFHYLAKTEYDPAHGNFSIISRKVADTYRALPEQLRFYGGIVSWLGFPFTSIEAEHGRRFAGRPSYTLGKRFRLAAHIILAHSDRPLRLAIVIGLLSAISSFGYGMYIFVRAISGGVSVEGWASTIVSIYFVGGIIMILLGIVGLYIGKIYDEVRGRPLYVLREVVGCDRNITKVVGASVREHR